MIPLKKKMQLHFSDVFTKKSYLQKKNESIEK